MVYLPPSHCKSLFDIALFRYLGLFFIVILKRNLLLILKLCFRVVRQPMRVALAGRGKAESRTRSRRSA
jgi:hypothetical protein